MLRHFALVQDAVGELYGTTYYGDQLKTGLTMDSAGNLYGTTAYGACSFYAVGTGCGVVFEITP